MLGEVVGDTLQIDEDALTTGVLILEFDWPLGDKKVPLRAIYPDSFPRFRPIVKLRGDPSDFPKRHCSPLDGNLCLLGRDSAQWPPQWALRDLLESQLESALTDTGDEDHQGEPAEFWWNSLGGQNSYCLVDSAWTLNGATTGTLQLRCCSSKVGGMPEVRAVVTEIRASDHAVIQQWNGPIPEELAVGQEITIPWMYVDETILPDPRGTVLKKMAEDFGATKAHNLSSTLTARWFAVIYKMEVGFQQEGLGWLFPFAFGSKQAFKPAKRGQRAKPQTLMIIPTLRAGESDLGARVPAVSVLRDKKIAVIGLGALGAPLALELARNGCSTLHLLDHDLVEPGNSIRWPLGTSAWRRGKSESLAEFVRREYPWCEAKPHTHAIGMFENDNPDSGDEAALEAILPNVDLVVDATASYGALSYLSDSCRALSVPIISLYASPPVKGGAVVRFAPQSGCPTCLEFAHHAHLIGRAPGFDEEGGLQQPPGCAERTFTGASFDLQELTLEALRLIIGTLESPQQANESVVHTLSLFENAQRIPPAWRVDPLPKQDGCSCRTAP